MKTWGVIRGTICIAMMAGTMAAAEPGTPWAVTADLTWASKYMTDGFNVGGDHPTWQPMLKLDTPLTGVSLKYWAALQADRANRAADEHDAMLTYSRDFLAGSALPINLHGYLDFWDYPNQDVTVGKDGDPVSPREKCGQKYHAGLSLPKSVPLAGSFLVPSYNYYFWNPNERETFQTGGRHELMLQYGHAIPVFIPRAKGQDVSAYASTSYHEGAFGVTPGWSHSTAGLSTGVQALGGYFGWGINYQWSYESSVNPEDDFWTTLSATYGF